MPPGPGDEDDAVELLKRRYAAGELDQEEFQRRLDDIIGDGRSAPPSSRTDDGSAPQRDVLTDKHRN
jgi:hypothetical protein